MDQDIFDGDIGEGGDGGDGDVGAGASAAAADLATAGALSSCLSCGASVVGPFCPVCGQKNDDLRRSSIILARDFLSDTFNFDSRMWRTLGLMAIAPGLVPSNYSHGRRSLYTPPVRLFLVISFLFFLTLGLTQTMFVALEVTKKDAEQIAAERQALEDVSARLSESEAAIEIGDNQSSNCNLNFQFRFFVQPKDISFDQEAWRACVGDMPTVESVDAENDASEPETEETKQAKKAIFRVISGITAAVEDPVGFNADINAWLPRVMLIMTPVLALLLALFIRGRDALLFDHLVLAFYSHAVGFAVIGAAIFAAQLGFKNAAFFAAPAIFIYFVAAVKRAYKRGWAKTLFASVFVTFLYFIILMSIVIAIVSNIIWGSA